MLALAYGEPDDKVMSRVVDERSTNPVLSTGQVESSAPGKIFDRIGAWPANC
jgi:hypothetical protein